MNQREEGSKAVDGSPPGLLLTAGLNNLNGVPRIWICGFHLTSWTYDKETARSFCSETIGRCLMNEIGRALARVFCVSLGPCNFFVSQFLS